MKEKDEIASIAEKIYNLSNKIWFKENHLG